MLPSRRIISEHENAQASIAQFVGRITVLTDELKNAASDMFSTFVFWKLID